MSDVRSVAILVLVAGVTLSGCSGPSADEERATTPTRTSTPTTTAASPEPSPTTTDALVSIAQRWRDHPEELPPELQGSSAVVDERGTGPETFTGLDLSGQESITIHVTCERDVPFRVHVGVPEDPERYFFAATSCSPDSSSSIRYPLASKGPATQATIDLPEGVTYYLTVYGMPPTVDGTTGPEVTDL